MRSRHCCLFLDINVQFFFTMHTSHLIELKSYRKVTKYTCYLAYAREAGAKNIVPSNDAKESWQKMFTTAVDVTNIFIGPKSNHCLPL